MFDKLKAIEDKFNEVNERLMQPEIVNDNKQYTALMKEYSSLSPIAEKFSLYKNLKQHMTKHRICWNPEVLTKSSRKWLSSSLPNPKRKWKP